MCFIRELSSKAKRNTPRVTITLVDTELAVKEWIVRTRFGSEFNVFCSRCPHPLSLFPIHLTDKRNVFLTFPSGLHHRVGTAAAGPPRKVLGKIFHPHPAVELPPISACRDRDNRDMGLLMMKACGILDLSYGTKHMLLRKIMNYPPLIL